MTKLDTTVIDESSVSPFTTLPPDQHPGGQLPDGVTYVTTAELRYLTELNYGPDAYRVTCPSCGDVMVFEQHPRSWENHAAPLTLTTNVELDDGRVLTAGTPIHLAVLLECASCGDKVSTQDDDAVDALTFARLQRRHFEQQLAEEIRQRLASPPAADGGVEVLGVDGGNGGDHSE